MSRSLIKGKFHGAVIRLAGCFSWPFRFADYSSGANLNRRSSCLRSAGTCAFHCPTVTLRNTLAERGLLVDHVTVWRWVQRYAPEIQRRLRPRLRPTNDSWRVDETYPG